MSKHENTVKLHDLMRQYQLDGPEVADLLGRSLKTVHCWRSESPLPIPTHMLELLELKLSARNQVTGGAA